MAEAILAIAAVVILIQQAVILKARARRKKGEAEKKLLEELAVLAGNGDAKARAELDCRGISKAARAQLILHACETEAEQGDCSAMLRLGHFYEVAGSAQEARAWYERAARMGNVEAMLTLGRGLGEDGRFGAAPKEAFHWFCEAARSGSGEALYHVGLCYETGQGVEADLGRAVMFYQRAIYGGEAFLPRMRLAGIYGDPDSGFFSRAGWKTQQDALLRALQAAGRERRRADYAKAALCLGCVYGAPWIMGRKLAPGFASKRCAVYLLALAHAAGAEDALSLLSTCLDPVLLSAGAEDAHNFVVRLPKAEGAGKQATQEP